MTHPAPRGHDHPTVTSVDRRTVLGGLLGLAWGAPALAQTAGQPTPPGGPAAPAAGAGDWPKTFKAGEQTINLYLPQLDSWDGHRLEAHAAVSVQASASAQPTFGVASFLADTQVDKGAPGDARRAPGRADPVSLGRRQGGDVQEAPRAEPSEWAATTGNVYHRWGDTTAVTRHSSGYNAWTGNRWAGSAGMSYNSRTGTIAAGQRAAVGNVYTGDYAYGARGAAVNPRTGQAVSAGRVTAGNVESGARGSAGYVRGQSGGIARGASGDIYATHDGNVYRNTGGGWEQRSGNSWSGVSQSTRTEALNREAEIRSTAQTRVNNYRASGGYHGGGFRGGRRR
jgi:hypothetical protein